MRIIWTDNFGNEHWPVPDFLADQRDEETMEEGIVDSEKPSPDETIRDFSLGK